MKFKKSNGTNFTDNPVYNEHCDDYPTEPIGKGNPYYRCCYCKISVPEINGYLKRHSEYCEYRLRKENGTW